MFSKETYIQRRAELRKLVGNGLVVLFGNNESPAIYPANSYAPMRQDSTFLYFFGQHRDGLTGIIDIDNDREMLLGDDIDVNDAAAVQKRMDETNDLIDMMNSAYDEEV